MTIEKVSDKTMLFDVDYGLEPTAGEYYGKSISMLKQLCGENERMHRLAAACNTLAAVMRSDLTVYQTKDAHAFVMYRHTFDLQEEELHFWEQIAKSCNELDLSVSTVFAQTLCMTAWFR